MSVQVGQFGFINVTTNQPIQAGSSASATSMNTSIFTVSAPPTLTTGATTFRAQVQGVNPGTANAGITFTNPDNQQVSTTVAVTVVPVPPPDVTMLTATAP